MCSFNKSYLPIAVSTLSHLATQFSILLSISLLSSLIFVIVKIIKGVDYLIDETQSSKIFV